MAHKIPIKGFFTKEEYDLIHFRAIAAGTSDADMLRTLVKIGLSQGGVVGTSVQLEASLAPTAKRLDGVVSLAQLPSQPTAPTADGSLDIEAVFPSQIKGKTASVEDVLSLAGSPEEPSTTEPAIEGEDDDSL